MIAKTFGFLQLSKKLLYDKQTLELSSSAKVLLIYLLAWSNSARNAKFFINHSEIENNLKFCRMTVWRLNKELKPLKIKYKSTKKQYHYDFTKFYHKWADLVNF